MNYKTTSFGHEGMLPYGDRIIVTQELPVEGHETDRGEIEGQANDGTTQALGSRSS